jgi:FkbH-like protein
MRTELIKCVVWDLDGTLWPGTLTEEGAGDTDRDVLQCLRELDHAGVLCSIASRNDAEMAASELEARELNDLFLTPRYTFGAKSGLVEDIARTLDIRLEHVCFVDDQPFEREEVASAHAEVRCFAPRAFLAHWQSVKAAYGATEVARHRRKLYQADLLRRAAEEEAGPAYDAFLRSLQLRMEIRRSGVGDWNRVHELLVRTNQFNSMGSGADTAQVLEAIDDLDGHLALLAKVEDRFGSYGDVGFCLIRIEPGAMTVVRLAFSCRVLSRGVGTAFLAYLVDCAAQSGRRLLVNVVNNERNRQLEIALRMAGFRDLGATPVMTLQGPDSLEQRPQHVAIDGSCVELRDAAEPAVSGASFQAATSLASIEGNRT